MAGSSDSGAAGQQRGISDSPSSAASSLSSTAASRPSSPPPPASSFSSSSPSPSSVCSGSNPGLSVSPAPSSVFSSAGLWSSVCPSSLKSLSRLAGTSATPPPPPPASPSSPPPPAGLITAVAASLLNPSLRCSCWQRRFSPPAEAELSLSLGFRLKFWSCPHRSDATPPLVASRSGGFGRDPSSRSKVAEQKWLRREEASPFGAGPEFGGRA